MNNIIPNYFFIDNKLHMKIKVVRSDDAVVAFCYEDESRPWLNRTMVRKYYKKAYTLSQAARLMNVKRGTLDELIKKKLVPMPKKSYDLANYQPLRSYISEQDMLDYRQAAWDQLPKNRFGEPYRDTMLSEVELIHAMSKNDDRDFVIEGDDVIKIFKSS